MKFNKWTLGLAAVGVVSLASAACADETKMSAVQTALSNTTISGYVDVSAQWNLGTGNDFVAPVAFQSSGSDFQSTGKADGFNLNVIDLTIDKPMDEGQWASGYHVELWFGQDASLLQTGSINWAANYANSTFAGANQVGTDYAIRQAYISLRTPIGNGIDWKIGVFDTIIGYESISSVNNPFYTHSYGFTIEPTTHTGIVGSYTFASWLSASAGVVNTVGPVINNKAYFWGRSEYFKTYLASLTLTAPQNWGWIAGSTLTGGVVTGTPTGPLPAQTSWYAGATLASPIAGIKFGASFDLLDLKGTSSDPWAVAVYGTYQATDKLSFSGRAEYANNYLFKGGDVFGATATIQYDLWANVISRLEFRWDHSFEPGWFGGNEVLLGPDNATFKHDAFMLAAQFIYKF